MFFAEPRLVFWKSDFNEFRRRGALVFVGSLKRKAPEMVFACGARPKTPVLVSEVIRLCRQNGVFFESVQNAMFRIANLALLAGIAVWSLGRRSSGPWCCDWNPGRRSWGSGHRGRRHGIQRSRHESKKLMISSII